MMSDNIDSDTMPWWTQSEIDQDQIDFEAYLSENPQIKDQLMSDFNLEQSKGYTASNTVWLFYKKSVLDKYNNHKYIHQGYDENKGLPFIRWLDIEPNQPPQSLLHYITGFQNMIKKWDNLSVLNDPNIIAIKQQDIFNVPPRQRDHFERHRVKVKA